ncbi:MAG: flavodoxin family protein [Candidatus Adiutrix sp.]|jgi:hypothetical protein|nr:flavodoxin family protein [Candidatus Adiutrix sp.]
MRLYIIHPDAARQPVAATVAREIHRSLPADQSHLACDSQAAPADDDFILAVFSLRPGSFAPLLPAYRELRDKKVAFVALLAGPADSSRARKTAWAIKKQFCGNQVLAGYLCPAEDDLAWGLKDDELGKILALAHKLCREHVNPGP